MQATTFAIFHILAASIATLETTIEARTPADALVIFATDNALDAIDLKDFASPYHAAYLKAHTGDLYLAEEL